jgi:hypothetical protein
MNPTINVYDFIYLGSLYCYLFIELDVVISQLLIGKLSKNKYHSGIYQYFSFFK